MVRYARRNAEEDLPLVNVIFYLEPIFYEDSEVFSSVRFVYNTNKHKYEYKSDNNPSRIIDGPLSGPGEELENPIKYEFEKFVGDCEDVIKDTGFTIIDKQHSLDSDKSEYFLLIGIGDKPCGRFVIDFRVSDHVLDKYHFPDDWKKEALKYLKINKIVNDEASEAGIDFKIDQVVVGQVKSDTWDRALNRLYARLRQLKVKIANK